MTTPGGGDSGAPGTPGATKRGIVGPARPLKSRVGPLHIVLGAFIILLVGAGAFGGSRAYRYIEEDPNFCRSCHVMEGAFEAWAAKEHKEVTCHACHEQSTFENARLLYKYVIFRPTSVSSHAEVDDERCKECHSSPDPRWTEVTETSGHRVHAEEQGIACVSCHTASLHEAKPSESLCSRCHSSQVLETKGMLGFHCMNCHEFLRPSTMSAPSLLPVRENCLSCHEGMEMGSVSFPEVAPMKLDCGTCHKPHQSEKPVDCQSCHRIYAEGVPISGAPGEAGPHGTAAGTDGGGQSDCTTCHKPHTWKAEK